MKKIKLAGTDHAEMLLGLTQDPTEITNAGGIRIMIRESEGKDAEFQCVGVERVGQSGTWEVVNSSNLSTLSMAILHDNIDSMDLPLLRRQMVFYIEVIQSVEGDPFAGLEVPFEDMDQITNVANPKLDEGEFIRNYATFFLFHYPTMCEKDPEYSKKYDAAMKRWNVQVAKLNIPVDITKRTPTGVKILYTLPAIMPSDDVYDNNLGESLNEITHEVSFLSQTDPGGAEKYLEQKLSDKIVPITSDRRKQLELEHVKAMDDIRARYDIPRWLDVESTEKKDDADTDGSSKKEEDSGFSDDEMGFF